MQNSPLAGPFACEEIFHLWLC